MSWAGRLSYGPAMTSIGDLRQTDDLRRHLRAVLRDIGALVGPRAVDEQQVLTLGGVPQFVHVRSQHTRNPVLLFLHGGPGSTVSDIAYSYQRPWEDFFTVVNWDQRGAGRSAACLDDDLTSLTRQQLVDDAVELIDHLRARFAVDRVVLVGQSWGTVLTLCVAAARPELLHAAVVQGLAVDWLASPELLYRRLCDGAGAAGDTDELSRLTALGPPPRGEDPAVLVDWAMALGVGFPDQNTWHNLKGEGDSWGHRMEALAWLSPDIEPEELADQQARAQSPAARRRHEAGMAMAMTWNADEEVGTRFDVPLVVMMGRHDRQTDVDVARAYYERVSAPWKKWVEFPNAAHALNIEQPGLSVVTLVNDVLPAVTGGVPAGAETGAVTSATG